MGASCCASVSSGPDPNAGYRRVLWIVLATNATMFAVEIGAGLAAGSASLQADALDFLGDAGNYAISLFVVGMALRYRAMAALAKGAKLAKSKDEQRVFLSVAMVLLIAAPGIAKGQGCTKTKKRAGHVGHGTGSMYISASMVRPLARVLPPAMMPVVMVMTMMPVMAIVPVVPRVGLLNETCVATLDTGLAHRH